MTDRDTVTALYRPPVRQSTLVRSGVDHTFDVFVRTLGVWWPRQPYSMGGDRVRDVTVEPTSTAGPTRPGTTAPSASGGGSWSGNRRTASS